MARLRAATRFHLLLKARPPYARESGCGETCPTGHRLSCCAGSRPGRGYRFQVVPRCEKVTEKSPSTNIFRHSATELHPEYCRPPSGRVQRTVIYKMFHMLFTDIIGYVQCLFPTHTSQNSPLDRDTVMFLLKAIIPLESHTVPHA